MPMDLSAINAQLEELDHVVPIVRLDILALHAIPAPADITTVQERVLPVESSVLIAKLVPLEPPAGHARLDILALHVILA
jgi:hypothetical protein